MLEKRLERLAEARCQNVVLSPSLYVRVNSLETIFRALAASEAKYLVVGGVAVVAHGHLRFTQDLDLVLNLSSDKLAAALEALRSLGYGPRIPVDILEFAQPEKRVEWQREKGMMVFNLFSPRFPDVTVDLFPSEPFDFDSEYTQAHFYPLRSDLSVPVVSLNQLIRMKKAAGRPQDLLDVAKLSNLTTLPE